MIAPTPSAPDRPDSPLTRLAWLELCHDGPVPAEAVAAALAGGEELAWEWQRRGLEALHLRLLAEARLGLARRRRGLPADWVSGDVWLGRLAADLAGHRATAVSLWPRCRGSDGADEFNGSSLGGDTLL